MEQFSLEEYLKKPSRKVVEGHGWPVRILCTDRKDDENGYVIVGLITERTDGYRQPVSLWNANGESVLTRETNLFFAPAKHEGWVNILDFPDEVRVDECVYDSYEEAKSYAKKSPVSKYYKATVKVEWEE